MNEPSRAALERCVGDPRRFLDESWGRRPLHHRSAGGFDDLLTFDQVDHILSAMGLRTPAFRLVKDGETIPTSRYTKSGRIGSTPVTGIADPARIFQEFNDGATVVLQGVHRFWLPLARFCRELEFSLGHPTQVNAYVTPPGSQGFGVHEDSHDVFVLQAFGSKHWEVFEPAASAHRSDAPAISVELQPGDSLYIPKGAPHSARTQDSVSGHLTVGVLTYTWTDVLQELFRLAEEEDTFTERLPPGYHGDEAAFSSAVGEKLEEFGRWVEKVEPNDLAGAMVRKFLTSRPSVMTGSLVGLIETDRITDQTVLRRRPHSLCQLRVAGDRLSAFLGDRELEMPASLLPAMNLVVDQERFQVSDLSPWLDEASRLVLSRRLIREGLLEAESVA